MSIILVYVIGIIALQFLVSLLYRVYPPLAGLGYVVGLAALSYYPLYRRRRLIQKQAKADSQWANYHPNNSSQSSSGTQKKKPDNAIDAEYSEHEVK